MHHDNTVVAIQADGKTFREYDHDKTQDTSSCNLVIPFNTEYAFLIKVLDDVRRRAVVTIDGIEAFDLILSKGNHVIERFGETAKKFKFVKADDPAVTDPTSYFNGRVQVKICREKPVFLMNTFHDHWIEKPMWPRTDYSDPYIGTPMWGLNQVMCCAMSSDMGATIEGSKSDQSFGQTYWNGDDTPYSFFNFTIRGKTLRKGYCVECGEALVAAHKFCGHCGTRV